MSDLCFLACYVCGKPVGAEPRLHRTGELSLDENGFGAVEACHVTCDLERLTELEPGPVVSPTDGEQS